jgi:hypothetical protein
MKTDTKTQSKTNQTTGTCNIHDHHDHVHGPNCGHKAIKHGDHVDYVHDGHLHRIHGNHVDECPGTAKAS